MSDDPQDLLAKVDLFQGLSARQLKKLVGRARVVPHAAGQVVSAEGLGSLAFHLVLSGEVTGSRVLELGGDTSYSLDEYVAALSAATGETITYVDQPVADQQAFLASVGVPAPMDAVLADADRGLAAGELLSDSGTLSALIGRPTTPLADAISAALA